MKENQSHSSRIKPLKPSRATKRKRSVATTDRISDLPDVLLHQILSNLDMKEVIQTSLIATRWRNLWANVPGLNFDYSLWKPSKARIDCFHLYVRRVFDKQKCIDFADRVFLLRDNSSCIWKINLSRHYCADVGHINTWLMFAVRRNVKQVHLEIPTRYDDEPKALYKNMFPSSIEVLKLKAYDRGGQLTVQVPKSMCSAHRLRSLELTAVKLPVGNSRCELVVNCPVLENLSLVKCDQKHLKILNLSSPRLKNLLIENRQGTEFGPCTLKICAPLLISLQLYGPLYKKFDIENLSSLVCAWIEGCHWSSDTRSLVELLKGICNVSSLALCRFESEHDLSSKMLSDQPLNTFLNLTHLTMYGYKEVASFLRMTPCIETLVVTCPQVTDWEKELLVHCSLDDLKFVEIQDFKGYENDLNLVKFLLINAGRLEIIKLSCAPPERGDRLLDGFSEKLHSLVDVYCSTVKVHFNDKYCWRLGPGGWRTSSARGQVSKYIHRLAKSWS
ncbi:hypothetical protein ACHQM5_015878 [Ranunculus cassubicifolius]